MKIKLDENLGKTISRILKESHADVETVSTEGLSGHPDEEIYLVCQQEQRFLITLDFSNVLRFPLNGIAGIVILRPAQHSFYDSLLQLISITAHELKHRPIQNRLWIVQPNKIRIRPALTLLTQEGESSDADQSNPLCPPDL